MMRFTTRRIMMGNRTQTFRFGAFYHVLFSFWRNTHKALLYDAKCAGLIRRIMLTVYCWHITAPFITDVSFVPISGVAKMYEKLLVRLCVKKRGFGWMAEIEEIIPFIRGSWTSLQFILLCCFNFSFKCAIKPHLNILHFCVVHKGEKSSTEL